MRKKPDRTMTCPGCGLRIDVSSLEPGSKTECACGRTLLVPGSPREAGKLSCPGCGAPLSADLHVCPWCRAGLQTVYCPKCFGMNFKGARFCGACGEKLERQAVDLARETPFKCPRCGDSLARHINAGCLLHVCGACGGVWVDSETMTGLCEGKDKAAVRRIALPFDEVRRAAGIEEKVTYVSCPVCGSKMNRFNFGKLSGVIVDMCRDHGTWFDKGEIQHCVEFVLSGGLDKAARREQEELKGKIEHLKSMAGGMGSGRTYTAKGARVDPVLGSGGAAEGFIVQLLRALLELL